MGCFSSGCILPIQSESVVITHSCLPLAKPFMLQTGASNVGLGDVPARVIACGRERVISFASRTLTAREQNYATMEKEALAVVLGT